MEETFKVLSPSSESAQDLALKVTVAHPQIPTMLTPIKPKASGLSETRTRATKDSAAEAIITIKTLATTKAMGSTRTKDIIKFQITKAKIMAGINNHMVRVRNHGRTTATNSKQIPMDRIRIADTSSSHRATDKDGTTTTNSRSRAMASRAGTTTTTKSRSRTMAKAGTPAISSNNHHSRMAKAGTQAISSKNHSNRMAKAGTQAISSKNRNSRAMDKVGTPAISSNNLNSRMASSRIGTSKGTTNSSLPTAIRTKVIADRSSRRRMKCLTLAASVKLTSLRSMILPGAKARLQLQKVMLAAGTMSARSTMSTSLTIPGANKAIIISL